MPFTCLVIVHFFLSCVFFFKYVFWMWVSYCFLNKIQNHQPLRHCPWLQPGLAPFTLSLCSLSPLSLLRIPPCLRAFTTTVLSASFYYWWTFRFFSQTTSFSFSCYPANLYSPSRCQLVLYFPLERLSEIFLLNVLIPPAHHLHTIYCKFQQLSVRFFGESASSVPPETSRALGQNLFCSLMSPPDLKQGLTYRNCSTNTSENMQAW